jgi:hypothetical protein
MESQALKLNDGVIELELAGQQKDALIDKNLKRIRQLNDQCSDDKKELTL